MTEATMPYEVEDMQPTDDMTEGDRLLLQEGPTKLECPTNDCPLFASSVGGRFSTTVLCDLGLYIIPDGSPRVCGYPHATVLKALDDLTAQTKAFRALVTQHMDEAARYAKLKEREK